MQRDPDQSGPADEFDRIVSAWTHDGPVPTWPDDDDAADPPEALDEPDPAATRAKAAADADRFVPPEPPPVPRPGPPALVGLGLLALGLILVTVPWWVGVPDSYGPPLGLVTLAGGLAWLVLRLWPDPPPVGTGDGEDDGAVL